MDLEQLRKEKQLLICQIKTLEDGLLGNQQEGEDLITRLNVILPLRKKLVDIQNQIIILLSLKIKD